MNKLILLLKALIKIVFKVLVQISVILTIILSAGYVASIYTLNPDQQTDTIRSILYFIEGPFGGLAMIIVFLACLILFSLRLIKKNYSFSWVVSLFIVFLILFVTRSMLKIFFKPVIYLYPKTTQDVDVKLEYDGELTVTYPEYNPAIKGWKVKASPDGTLINSSDKRTYSYLFWEGISRVNYSMPEKGFVVTGQDSARFLQKILEKRGLTPREYNELIVFWYPLIKNYPYVQIAFAGQEYEDSAKLSVNPKPDSVLRVFLYFKKLSKYPKIEEQKIETFERKGFSVVEWGGTIID